MLYRYLQVILHFLHGPVSQVLFLVVKNIFKIQVWETLLTKLKGKRPQLLLAIMSWKKL